MTHQSEETPQVALDTSRLTAHEIFEGAVDNGRRELGRPFRALAFSGLAGGVTMGLTGMSVAVVRSSLPPGPARDFVPFLFYPLGFIAVIIGRAQLFTENTLYPVVLILRERKHLFSTLRLWGIVFAANLIGAAAFSALVTQTPALMPNSVAELVQSGVTASAFPFGHIFWTGIIGGWLIALVAWMVTASHWTIGQITVVWLLTFIVGIGRFAHCIAATGEILSAVFYGAIPFSQYVHWIIPATLGNIVGGVFIVSLLNYGQVAPEQTD